MAPAQCQARRFQAPRDSADGSNSSGSGVIGGGGGGLILLEEGAATRHSGSRYQQPPASCDAPPAPLRPMHWLQPRLLAAFPLRKENRDIHAALGARPPPPPQPRAVGSARAQGRRARVAPRLARPARLPPLCQQLMGGRRGAPRLCQVLIGGAPLAATLLQGLKDSAVGAPVFPFPFLPPPRTRPCRMLHPSALGGCQWPSSRRRSPPRDSGGGPHP